MELKRDNHFFGIEDNIMSFAKEQQGSRFEYSDLKRSKQYSTQKFRIDQQAEAKSTSNHQSLEVKKPTDISFVSSKKKDVEYFSRQRNDDLLQEQRKENDSKVSGNLNQGDKVFCRYRGSFLPAQVSRNRQDGTYDILFTNGARQLCVPKSSIRREDEDVEESNEVSVSKQTTVSNNDLEEETDVISKRGKIHSLTQSNAMKGNDDEGYHIKGGNLHKKASDMIQLQNAQYDSMMRGSLTDTNVLGVNIGETVVKKSKYLEGSKVECKYRGKSKYYPATIKQDHCNGTYDVIYEDGDREYRVAEDLIRPHGQNDKSLPHLTREANNVSHDKDKDKQEVPKIDKKVPSPKLTSRKESRGDESDSHNIEDENSNVRNEVETCEGGSSTLIVGSKVECRYRGKSKYYPATIKRDHGDGTYDILYEDGDRELKVANELIRPRRRNEKSLPNMTKQADTFSSGKEKDEQEVSEEDKVSNMSPPGFTCKRRRDETHVITEQQSSLNGKGKASNMDGPLKVGSKVECRYRGKSKYYLATIKRDHGNGTFDLLYEDGDREFRVAKNLIRIRDHKSKPNLTQQTTDLSRGKYKGKQETKRDETSNISSPQLIHRREAEGTTITSKTSSTNKIIEVRDANEVIGCESLDTSATSDYDTSSASDEEGNNMGDTLLVGSRVESRYRGKSKYFPATIKRDHGNGTFDLLYEDGDREFRVAKGLIRSRDEKSSTHLIKKTSSMSHQMGKGKHVHEVTKVTKTLKVDEASKASSPKLPLRGNGGEKRDIRVDLTTEDTNLSHESKKNGSMFKANLEYLTREHEGVNEGGNCACGPLIVGSKVECRYRGKSKYYPATIRRDHGNGKFDLIYEDGDREFRVAKELIRLLNPTLKPVPLPEREIENKECTLNHSSITLADPENNSTFGDVHSYGGGGHNAKENNCKNNSENIKNKEEGPHRGNNDSELSVGLKVEGRYKGKSKYYPATIKHDHGNGTYDLQYEDGDREFGVNYKFIRVIKATDDNIKVNPSEEKIEANPFTRHMIESEQNDSKKDNSLVSKANSCEPHIIVGAKVECRFKGSSVYYPAKVTRDVGNGTYDIHYDDGDEEFGVAKHYIRNKSFSITPGACKDPGQSQKHTHPAKSWGENEHKVNILQIGCQVECRYKGLPQYYPATIRRIHNDGTYDVSYDDGDEEFRVSRDLINTAKCNTTEKLIKQRGVRDITLKGNDYKLQNHHSGVLKSGDHQSGCKEKYHIGSRVEANFKNQGEFYPGRIIFIDKGYENFDVKYDDGDLERAITKDRIRIVDDGDSTLSRKSIPPTFNSEQTSFAIGSKVNVRYKGGHNFFPGTILSCRDNRYDILYDDGDREFGVEDIFIKNDDYHSQAVSDVFIAGQNVQIRVMDGDSWYQGRIEATQRDGAVVLRLKDASLVQHVY